VNYQMSLEGFLATGITINRLSSGIAGKTCALTLLTPAHTSHVVKWRNDPENARWFLTSQTITAEGHEKWLAQQSASGKHFNWLIQLDDGTPVGMISVYNLDPSTGSAEFGRLLIGEPEALGKGIGREASELAIALSVSAGLSELYLSVLKNNAKARTLYDKLGFIVTEEDETTTTMRKPLTARLP
jgi:RimJ/RimL family protein N-acetyltransferase